MFMGFPANDGLLQIVFGLCSFLTGIGLIVYGVRFLRKLKNVSYL